MAFSLEDGYTAEQVILMAVSLALLALFAIQWQAERKQEGKFGSKNVKYKLHRIGVVVAALLVAVCVDPFCVHGLLGEVTVEWLNANVTALLICGVIFLNQTAMEVTYLAKLAKAPRLVGAVHWLFCLGLVVFANVAYYLVLSTNRALFSGVFVLFAAAVLGAFVLSFVFVTWRILQQLSRADSNTHHRAENEAKKRMMRTRALGIFALGVVVVPLLVISATDRLRFRDAPIPDPDQDRFSLRDRGYLYLEIVGTIVCLWYSWMPPSPSRKHAYMPIGSQASWARGRSTGSGTGSASQIARAPSLSDGSDAGAAGPDADRAPTTSWKAATAARLRGSANPGMAGSETPSEEWDLDVTEERN